MCVPYLCLCMLSYSQRNYRYFFLFVVTTTLQCALVIGECFTLVVHRSIVRDENFWVVRLSIVSVCAFANSYIHAAVGAEP